MYGLDMSFEIAARGEKPVASIHGTRMSGKDVVASAVILWTVLSDMLFKRRQGRKAFLLAKRARKCVPLLMRPTMLN